MELGEKAVVEPARGMGRDGEEQPGHRDGKEQEQRHQVGGKLLQGQRSTVAGAAPHGDADSGQHQHRGDVEHVEHQWRDG